MFYPPYRATSLPLHIVGIDPGTDTLGIGVIAFCPTTFTIVESTAYTVHAGRQMPTSWLTDLHGSRYMRLRYITEAVYGVLVSAQPVVVAAESNFFDVRRPSAYGALVESVNAVSEALNQYDSTMTLDMLTPREAKIGVGAPINAKKDEVLTAIQLLPLNYTGQRPIHCLDEHSSDSLAIAYTSLQRLRLTAMARQTLLDQHPEHFTRS